VAVDQRVTGSNPVAGATLIVAAAAVASGLAMRTRLPTSALAILTGVGLQALPALVDAEVVRDGLLMAATFSSSPWEPRSSGGHSDVIAQRRSASLR
jgi:hypothetical protein